MAKKTDFKQSLSQLSDKLKEPSKTPIQEVRPVESSEAINTPKKETHVNFWVPEELMIRLKVYAALNRKSIKEIGIEALEAYLPKIN